MPRVVIYLNDEEHAALAELSKICIRPTQAQAYLIIRNELLNRGFLVYEDDIDDSGLLDVELPEAREAIENVQH